MRPRCTLRSIPVRYLCYVVELSKSKLDKVPLGREALPSARHCGRWSRGARHGLSVHQVSDGRKSSAGAPPEPNRVHAAARFSKPVERAILLGVLPGWKVAGIQRLYRSIIATNDVPRG